MNVLIVGSGAREHALAWKLHQSPSVDCLFVAPGNPGTASLATNLPIGPLNFQALGRAARENDIGLVVVGPEVPLAAGLADGLARCEIPAYGPVQEAARIESSKAFAKRLMARAAIPTGEATVYHDFEAAAAHVHKLGGRCVIKADGLAAGKGVTVPGDEAEALAALRAALVNAAFGDAGRTVLVEERLYGREVSAHAFCDGTIALPMPYACDHKAVFDGGIGPNTGGMGAYSPPRFLDGPLQQTIFEQIVQPAIRTLAAQGTPYRGTLYPGLMITDAGPRVIEFNCRFGDPETQVLLPRLRSDLFDPLWQAATGSLAGVTLDWSSDACVGVVLAAEGYPGAIRTGDPIDGLDEIDPDVRVFQAGTALDAAGRLVTAGGRVCTVVATGPTMEAACTRVYANVERIRFRGRHFRTDIGLDEA